MAQSSCRVCRFEGCDVRLTGCSCTLHAACVPVGLIATFPAPDGSPQPIAPNALVCPFCNASAVSGIHLLPLGLESLDEAVELRKNGKGGSKHAAATGKDKNFLLIEAESTYLNLAHSNSNSLSASLSDNEFQRTGRWTSEEIAYVDFLLDAFDKGKLPIAQGVRLNDFLGEILLCKGSRLTKKMKNARLSLRSYELAVPTAGNPLDCVMLSTVQEKFFQSISSEAMRAELKFNTTKVWRSHFSNFCLQLSSKLLDASDWISSLEMMERRAAQAEENIRKARRRRMGLALKTDVRTAADGVYFGGLPVHRVSSKIKDANQPGSQQPPQQVQRQQDSTSSHGAAPGRSGASSQDASSSLSDRRDSVHSVTSSDDGEGSEAEFISNMLDMSMKRAINPMEEFSMQSIADLFDNPERRDSSSSSSLRNNCGSFLEEIVNYMEENDLPFQHVDVWVPSYLSGSQTEELRLCHAGHATRTDIDPALFCQLHEYGEYSTKFSFAPGVGLPGRVYSTDKPSWECSLDEADPKQFERAGGAKVYGVKTGFGFSLATSMLGGKMVVAMYSTSSIAVIPQVIEKCITELGKYVPEPKWKLVVEMSDDAGKGPGPVLPPHAQVAAMTHYKHSAPVKGAAAQTTPSVPAMNVEAAAEASGPPAAAAAAAAPAPPQSDEQRIATLLGDHMPLSDLPGVGQNPASSTNQPADMDLLPHFMSLRLLLLRSANRRSPEEADCVDVVVKSYQGYSADPRRSDRDLALLLVQDWKYLCGGQKPAANQEQQQQQQQPQSRRDSVDDQQHQCHVMDAPLANTYSSSGAPIEMPTSLTYVEPTNGPARRGSFDDMVHHPSDKKRRVSTSNELEVKPFAAQSTTAINIVDEN